MFKESRVIPIFPTTLWAHTLSPEIYEPMNQRLKAALGQVREIAYSSSPKPSRTSAIHTTNLPSK